MAVTKIAGNRSHIPKLS